VNTKTVTTFNRAFTLIELLIVVAIIAILAAIAVPNFLEAQIRAKVSRAKADMRSIATAIEAYHVDYTSYVPSTFATSAPPDCPQPATNEHTAIEDRYEPLTTPVAFISSVPNDAFGDLRIDRGCFGTIPLQYKTFEFVTNVDNGSLFEQTFLNQLETQLLGSFSGRLNWYLASQGPDETPGLELTGLLRSEVYDPTNGTTSSGDIFRTGPGGIVSD
jgi:prepilin-type N-terminal cleavage/methylation domain-containing protein